MSQLSIIHMKKYITLIILFILSDSALFAQTFSTLGVGCNNKVFAITGDMSASNVLYAGGEFLNAGGSPVNYVAKWNGSAWSSLDGGMNYHVRSLVYFNNELHAGGGFNTVGSGANQIIAWGVAKWNGSTWSNLGNGIRGAGDNVYAMTEYGGELYAGGFFDTLSGFNPGRGIQKWNGSTWIPLGGTVGGGVSGPPGFRVRALQVFNGELYVGGTFIMAGAISASNIAKWNGSSWSAIGTGMNGDVHAFTVYNGELYIGGDFTLANGVSVNHLAKLSGNTFVNIGGGVNGIIYGLNVYQNNLYVTGNFTVSGTVVNTQNISRWDGANWYPLSLGIDGLGGYCLTPFNGNLYVGGFFAVAGTVLGANSIAYWNMPTGIDEVTQGDFIIYPNPSNGIFSLKTSRHAIMYGKLLITDIQGRLVFTSLLSLPQNQISGIDISGFSKGVYYLEIRNESQFLRKKIILQ